MQEGRWIMKQFLFIKGVYQKPVGMTQEKFDIIMDFSNDEKEVIEFINKYPKYADIYSGNILRKVQYVGVPNITEEIRESIWEDVLEMISGNTRKTNI